jgi:phosphate starvation-inducible protein PhoH
MNKLRGVEGVSVCELTYCDIIRSDVVARILEKLNEDTDFDGKIR